MRLTLRNAFIVFLVFAALVAAAAYFLLHAARSSLWPSLQLPEFQSVDTSKPLSSQHRVVKLGSRTFSFPRAYIDARLEAGEEQDGITFRYVLPNYLSLLEFRTKDEYDRAFKEGHFAFMLLEPASIRPPLNIIIYNREEGLTRKAFVKKIDVFEVYEYYHGLKSDPQLWSEMYIEKDDKGHILSFIDCSAYKSATTPMCEHIFIDKNILYHVIYRKVNYLTSWRTQKVKAISFVDNYEIAKGTAEK